MHVPFRTSEKCPHSPAHLAFITLGLVRPGARPCSARPAAQLPPCSIAELPAFRSRQIVLGFLLQRDRAFDGVAVARARAVRAIAVTLLEPRASVSGGLTLRITTRLIPCANGSGPSTDICCWDAPALCLPRRPGPIASKIALAGIDMGEVEAAHVADREFAEHIVEPQILFRDRASILTVSLVIGVDLSIAARASSIVLKAEKALSVGRTLPKPGLSDDRFAVAR